MNMSRAALVVLSVVAGGCGEMATAPAGSPEAPSMPHLAGITGPDRFPRGCVDCHIVLDNGEDHRLNAGIVRVPDHPPLEDHERIPDDCRTCHEAGSEVGAMDTIIHAVHYRNPGKNHFITLFQGACLFCHRMEGGTGKMSIKSGKRNW